MEIRHKFQGDLHFFKVTAVPDPRYIASHLNNRKPITKPTVLHMGEGKNHGHVIEGEGVTVGRMTNTDGIYQCYIMVTSKAKVMHKDVVTGKAPSDGEGHGTLTLEPGLHIMRTQREGANEQQVHHVSD